MPFASDAERQIADKVLTAIRSEKYKSKNYLFLEPFDLSQVPGYVEKIGEPLDLRLIASNLQNNVYDNTSFWRDLDLVFQNAIKYHGEKQQTKWIAKFAKDMLKAVAKERKAAENPEKKPKLKLQQPIHLPMSDAAPAVEAKKPKIKLKMSKSSAESSQKEVAKKAKPTQPKFKLKLSLKKPTEPKPEPPKKQPEPAIEPSKPAPPPTKKIKPATASRGKELPQGIVMPSKQKKQKKAPVKKTSIVPKSTSKLEPSQKRQCCKVILGLKRRKQKQISWFLTPVSDKNILQDYRSKIKQPMDLATIQSKLDKGWYKKIDAVVLDIRRVFANALRYNTSIKDSLRPLAVQVLQTAETLLQIFVYRHHPGSYKPLLYCWKVCIDILDTLYNLVNPNDGQPMAYYFLHPVSVYCGGQFPPDYREKVQTPMDFGTITANLVEGAYQTVEAFSNDCRLVVQNCQTYYADRDDGKLFVEQALSLNDVLTTQLSQLARYDKSKGPAERQKLLEQLKPNTILQKLVVPKQQPPAALYLSVVEDLRALQYTDKATKISQPAMGPFEEPVSLTLFTDYMQFVSEPMDLQSVQRKINGYETPEDFEYDMNLIWKNCEVYNAQRNDQHSVAMAKFAARKFRSIFYGKMQAFEDPASVEPPLKKVKLEPQGGDGKSAPRISITAPQIVPKPIKSPTTPKKLSSAPPTPKPKPNQPIPLHIAIAKVKEAFPLRRSHKSLQPWEADCARYFKELMRHPWITTARPKFIFHVPVPVLFPELKEPYAAKIRKPMDLTTVECTLLAGNRYAGPEDFVQDVALVFCNAIRFNKDGRDVGDPLSCAYYDASVHLLRYARWLSLELLISHIEATDHTDEAGADGLPPYSWKLTEGNRKIARQETESIVLKESIDKSLEGDRYTWMEAECEKLLKALRHQSDLRYMTFFIQPHYPANYTTFIATPMDWEKVNRTLKKRQYETIGHLIDDLRLIFSNAEKYNSHHKGRNSVSGLAYKAAKYMLAKLELAINKLLLSVSDRLERERIDHGNAERELEAIDRAAEAEVRASWKKEGEEPATNELQQQQLNNIRVIRRAPQQRRQEMDFEIPYFDEEDDGSGQHERSHFEVVKFQKAMFEKQRQDLLKMRRMSLSIGSSVFARMMQIGDVVVVADNDGDEPMEESASNDAKVSVGPSSVLNELERQGRGRVQMKLALPKAQMKKKKATKKRTPLNGFD